MNLNEKENYRQDDQYFQDDETRYDEDHQYDDINIDAPPADHSISDNAEPDYGNEFAEDEINNPNLATPKGDKFDEEFDNDDDNDLEDEELEDDDLEDDELDEEDFDQDEEGTDPNRNL